MQYQTIFGKQPFCKKSRNFSLFWTSDLQKCYTNFDVYTGTKKIWNFRNFRNFNRKNLKFHLICCWNIINSWDSVWLSKLAQHFFEQNHGSLLFGGSEWFFLESKNLYIIYSLQTPVVVFLYYELLTSSSSVTFEYFEQLDVSHKKK